MSFFSSRSRQLWVYFLLVKTTGRWLHPRPGPMEGLLRELETVEDFQMLSDEWVCLPVSDIGLPKRHTWDWSHATFPRSCQEWRNLSWVLAHIQRRFISNDSTTLWLFQEFITNHTLRTAWVCSEFSSVWPLFPVRICGSSALAMASWLLFQEGYQFSVWC